MMLFELYFGNKSDKLIKKMNIQFQGDKRMCIPIKKA